MTAMHDRRRSPPRTCASQHHRRRALLSLLVVPSKGGRPPPLMGAAASLPFLTRVSLPHHFVTTVAAVSAPTSGGGQCQWGRGAAVAGGGALVEKARTYDRGAQQRCGDAAAVGRGSGGGGKLMHWEKAAAVGEGSGSGGNQQLRVEMYSHCALIYVPRI